MITTKGYAAQAPSAPLSPYTFDRKDPGVNDVTIDILYCGVCHADIHQAKNEYGGTAYPFVPGHEIIGRVHSIGKEVARHSVGDLVGVGYFLDSCRHCSSCEEGEEQYCEKGITPTQNARLKDGTVTKGGYSNTIVVDERYVLKVSESLAPAGVAPLLCAGITTYSPLRHWNVGKGHKVAVLGLGGVGHMAVKFAASFGAEVTVLSGSPSKRESALALGATHFVVTSDVAELKAVAGRFDFLIDAVSAKHDYNAYLGLLKKDGTMILLGVPPEAPQLAAFQLIARRRKIAGSFIGGIAETQEMLDYCADHNITADVEVIAPDYINDAFERTLKGDVQYRFVIDMTRLG
ncbi:NAD(P)-dependent alcohol dehydrogenase [Dinghuibacter silviterrae]|uniref:Putative zinc-type alcohol dehydrogenase-like protein n=1 Tax=Dinghuibacter silviterrae TaxID=1539049 RepID=A0A4R8DPH0_9BACT|nr:NAD(P)-dependent alcohol dehydrogenase [Dinghuibacter silviterrae]TDW99010.1 putative zinc-type alcohol dehydrogenase-like protein [Dinghuibacter silviterrae]